MAKRTTEVLVKVTLAYDDEQIDEGTAQDIWLQETFPANRLVEVHHAAIVAGLVDADGVPVQPSVRRILDNKERET